jgi:hypothetical protein
MIAYLQFTVKGNFTVTISQDILKIAHDINFNPS